MEVLRGWPYSAPRPSASLSSLIEEGTLQSVEGMIHSGKSSPRLGRDRVKTPNVDTFRSLAGMRPCTLNECFRLAHDPLPRVRRLVERLFQSHHCIGHSKLSAQEFSNLLFVSIEKNRDFRAGWIDHERYVAIMQREEVGCSELLKKGIDGSSRYMRFMVPSDSNRATAVIFNQPITVNLNAVFGAVPKATRS